MFKKIFGGGSDKKKGSLQESSLSEKERKEIEKRKKKQRSATIAAPETTYDRRKRENAKASEAPPRLESSARSSSPNAKKSDRAEGGRKPKKAASTREEKKHRKKNKKPSGSVDVSQPLEYPCTPECILEHHKAKSFLSENEEWLLVELNEFECLVDGLDIIKVIAKHSKFFEVDPDELWEEFFEFVEEVPAYDEVINYDIWQEFRDEKYPC